MCVWVCVCDCVIVWWRVMLDTSQYDCVMMCDTALWLRVVNVLCVICDCVWVCDCVWCVCVSVWVYVICDTLECLLVLCIYKAQQLTSIISEIKSCQIPCPHHWLSIATLNNRHLKGSRPPSFIQRLLYAKFCLVKWAWAVSVLYSEVYAIQGVSNLYSICYTCI